ncbi:MAG: hypothetical protein KME42_02130 [Tildeniella nuda ZEHNDER 1965/U140]|jgi:hypothetical protein|nr:hypothetical protein [Tildeniella nuda ZEHNDER 1965/U140]
MLRKFLVFSMALTLIFTSVGCGNPDADKSNADARSQPTQSTSPAAQSRLSDGEYPVQQATYNDDGGEYNVALLNTKPGESSAFRATNLQMARLTNEEVAAGKKSYLKVEKGQPSLYLTEDFKIEYVHNVTETQNNPQTGRQETVVVRQESNFWTPFAGALAGQALGSLLFRPQYYMPPAYQPGVPMAGYGGYGSSYNQAVNSYQSRYQAPPAAVRNNQLRTTGQLRTPSTNTSRTRNTGQSNRSTGSGFGNSTLRQSDRPSGSYRSPSRGFGSSGSRSFGGRRR